MGAFQRERRRAPPSYARLLAAYDTHVFYRAEESTRRSPTDGGIRLINISVDSGPDSCRDEKLAKFRVTEGRKEGRKTGMECTLRKFENSSSASTKTPSRNGIEDIDVVGIYPNV